MDNLEYYVVYDTTTGDIRIRGSGPLGQAAIEAATNIVPPLAVVAVPYAAVSGEAFNLDVVKDSLCAQVDAEAEALRSRFATPGSGQAMEYQEAVAQARALVDGKPGPFAMLAADVAAGTIDARTGNAVASDQEAADLILWMHAQWVAIGSAIREARLGAKAAVRAGTNIGQVVDATKVDWGGIVAGAMA
ncbi:MAG: hypothetical protein BGP16_05590 [Sphingobium sp. 66-54]|nr:MAG: hypothetical protein BGP16_05590 [Sphingobium sp. 66-54]